MKPRGIIWMCTTEPVQVSSKQPKRHLSNGHKCNVGSIKLVAEETGYVLVALVGHLDAILIRRDLLPEDWCMPPLSRFSNRVAFIHSCVMNKERTQKWVEYSTYVKTGDIRKSRLAAIDQILLIHFPTSGAPGSAACLGIL